jgi:hypothetical protein
MALSACERALGSRFVMAPSHVMQSSEWQSQSTREELALARSRFESRHPSIVCIDVARTSSWQYRTSW